MGRRTARTNWESGLPARTPLPCLRAGRLHPASPVHLSHFPLYSFFFAWRHRPVSVYKSVRPEKANQNVGRAERDLKFSTDGLRIFAGLYFWPIVQSQAWDDQIYLWRSSLLNYSKHQSVQLEIPSLPCSSAHCGSLKSSGAPIIS